MKAWLEAHKPARPDRSARSPPDLSDPPQQQKIITRLEEQGVVVNEVEAEIQSGDSTAVKTWLETYLQAHEGEMPFHHHSGEAPPVGSADTGQ
ncbi:MAG: hypothetical protein LUO97_07815 [Methanomicrobiales archaeon]|nr:hypothetical protein [Methanomicrobiales archaeon]